MSLFLMKNKRFFIAIIFVFLSAKILFAQEVENQLWMNYALTVPVNEKWTYGGDVGLRGLISNYDWNQFLIRPNVNYRINYTFSISPAIAWFSTLNRDAGNINEFRIHQDFNAKWPDLGFIEFFWRLRIEQRWFFYQDEEFSYDFNLRLRALVGVETADISLFGPKRPIYFQIIYEGFTTVEETAVEIFVNQARLHFALGHRISEAFRYELHYIRQGSRLFVEDGLGISQNILQITFVPSVSKEVKLRRFVQIDFTKNNQ